MIRRCEDCRWWDNSVQHGNAKTDMTGMCRRNPPTAEERDHTAVWPFTEFNDWCFSFTEKEPPEETDIQFWGRTT